MPRIRPLTPDAATGLARALLEQTPVRPDGAPLAVFGVGAHHPGLLQWWMPFGRELLVGGVLRARDRELLTLRTAHRCGSSYILAAHGALATAAGLDDTEIARVAAGPARPGWSSLDAALLSAADDLHDASRIEATTWVTLSRYYDEQALLEVIFVVGFYTMLAFYLNSTDIEPEVVGMPVNDAIDHLGRPVPAHRPAGS